MNHQSRRDPIRCLVLNVDVGSGHRLAAEALREALEALRPGTRFTMVESLDYLGSKAGQMAKEVYLGMQESLPDLWGLFYEQRSLFDLLRPLGEVADGLRVEKLIPLAHSLAPQVIIATHPIACGLGAALKRSGGIKAPLVAVVTDLDGHPAWVARGVDLFLAANGGVVRDLESHGAPRGSAVATGIPLRRSFAQTHDINAIRARLSLPAEKLTILLLGGGLGLGPIIETAKRLTGLGGPVQLVLIAGRNEELERQGRHLARGSGVSLQVRGFVDNMPEYMAIASIAIGKPGGITCAELMASGIPLIALKPLAGQEEANCLALEREGAALRADSPGEAYSILVRLLSEPSRLERMRLSARGLGRPGAAGEGARRILGLVERGEQ